MTSTTSVVLLLLPLALVRALTPRHTYKDELYVDGPLNNTRHPVFHTSSGSSTTGFDSSDGYRSNLVETHLARIIPDGDFPVYLEVKVSQTDMSDRDPTTGKCLDDSLTFYEGNSTDGPVLVEVCGRETPTFDTRGLDVFGVFNTSATQQRKYKGAKMDYFAVYGKIHLPKAKRNTLETFVFPSYGYVKGIGRSGIANPPLPPPIRRTITLEASHPLDIVGVYVNETHMFGLDADTESCSRDKVIFYDGNDTSAAVLATVCGTDTPTIRSTGSFMTVYFEARSLQDEPWRGMTIFYQAEEPPAEIDGATMAGIANVCVVIVTLITAGIVY